MGVKRIMLCADSQSLSRPMLLGLDDQRLEAIPWLVCVSSANSCRETARMLDSLEEVWVVSCDDMDSINVAATLKSDDPEKRVYLVSFGNNGSLASRAAAAKLDGVLNELLFAKRYEQVKRVCSMQKESCFPQNKENLPGFEGASDGEKKMGGDAYEVGACERPVARSGFETKSNELASLKSSGNASAPSKLKGPANENLSGKAAKAVTIAVVSGTGGSGKSAIAAVLSLISLKAGLSTAVLDADLQFGDMDYLLGIQEPIHMEDIMADRGRLRELEGAPVKDRPALVAAPRRIELSEVVVSEIPETLEMLKGMFEVVVVNTGSLWSDSQAVVLESADSVIFAMDARPSSLRATAHAMELCVRLGIATTGFTFVVNRHERTSLLSAVDVACALHGAKAVEVPYGGRDVDELLGAGCPEELFESKNAFVEALRDILVGLLSGRKKEMVEKTRGTKKKKSFFSRGGQP